MDLLSRDQLYFGIQPWFKINTVDYEEIVAPILRGSLARNAVFYQFKTKPGDLQTAYRLPEVNIDIVFELDECEPQAYFFGLSDELKKIKLLPDTNYFVIKHKYLFYVHEHEKLVEMNQQNFPIGELFKPEMTFDSFLNETKLSRRINIYREYFNDEHVDPTYETQVEEMIAEILHLNAGNIDMTTLSEMVGYSERYISKKFKETFNIPPIKYSNVLRLNRAIQMLINPERNFSLLEIALNNNYHDEAHFIKNFKQVTRLTPTEFKEMNALKESS